MTADRLAAMKELGVIDGPVSSLIGFFAQYGPNIHTACNHAQLELGITAGRKPRLYKPVLHSHESWRARHEIVRRLQRLGGTGVFTVALSAAELKVCDRRAYDQYVRLETDALRFLALNDGPPEMCTAYAIALCVDTVIKLPATSSMTSGCRWSRTARPWAATCWS